MERRKKLQVFLLVVFCLLISVFPAYSFYRRLTEINPFSTELAFESPDQENLPIDQQDEYKGSVASLLSMPYMPSLIVLKQLFSSPCQIPSTDQNSFILRC
jgi:hypothetical protein